MNKNTKIICIVLVFLGGLFMQITAKTTLINDSFNNIINILSRVLFISILLIFLYDAFKKK